MNELDELLREQAAYYHDQAHRANRVYETVEEYRSPELLTDGLPVIGDVLDLACGGGQWTKILAARGHRVTAVDASSRMLAKARKEVVGPDVELVKPAATRSATCRSSPHPAWPSPTPPKR